ncbi:hypothetical protein [Massilia consociata]|uniref:Uncharacterized protein n=1 Tax=Massilia consociata TaxID=760117 RepID=A0ABV6FI54_9BURK
MTEHLLRPSLANNRAAVALYSPQSSFLLGFFMGPLPLILYSALNSIRLQRPRDTLAYAIALAAFLALVYASFLEPRPAALAWINDQLGEGNSMRGATRILAVVLWGCFYLMHRKEHRSVDLLGTRPSPWIAAIGCAVAGMILMYGISFVFLSIYQP